MAETRRRGTEGRSHHRSGRGQDLPERVIASVILGLRIADGCWLPKGSVNGAGYHRRSWTANGRDWHLFAHQIVARAFLRAGGPLWDGEVVHHKCRTRRCVNPLHLQILTADEHFELHKDDTFAEIYGYGYAA